MKTKMLLVATFCSLLIAGTSCKKDEKTDTFASDQQVTQDQNQTDAEVEDVASIQDDVMTSFDSKIGRIAADSVYPYESCATVTIVPKGNNTTGTITVNYGATGCVGADGRTRKGIIRFTFTDRIRKPGAVITTSFENYAVKGVNASEFVSIDNSSTKITTNKSQSPITGDNAILNFERQVNMRLNFSNGTFCTWTGTKNVEWRLGVLLNRWDNVYVLKSGSGLAGVGRNNQPYTLTVNSDVVRKAECAKIGIYKPVSGKVTIMHNNKTKVIDYGSGTCDRMVTITINGVVRTTRW